MKYSRLLILLLAVCFVAAHPRVSDAAQFYIAEEGVGSFNYIYQESSDPVFSAAIGDWWDWESGTTVAGWSGTLVSSYITTGSGVDREKLEWTIYFADSYVDTAFSFDVKVYNGSTLVDWATVYYSGGGDLSSWDNFTIMTHDISSVPEPATLLLLGLGLLGVAPLRKMAA
jgi:hypothetical protein